VFFPQFCYLDELGTVILEENIIFLACSLLVQISNSPLKKNVLMVDFSD